MKVSIRRADKDDVPELAKMVARLKTLNEELSQAFRTTAGLEEEAARYIEESMESGSTVILVAESDGEVVGFVKIDFVDRRFYEPRMKAEITDIYVKPMYRRQGLGKLLVEAAKDEARKRGAGIVSAIFPSNNVIAKRFYEGLGFKDFQLELYIKLD